MSPVLENISANLLPELEGVTAHEKWLDCSQKFPWYPLPWLMLANEGHAESVAKAALWFADEPRLHYLLHQPPPTDTWLAEQLALLPAGETVTQQQQAAGPEERPLPENPVTPVEAETITATEAIARVMDHVSSQPDAVDGVAVQSVFPGLKSSLDNFSKTGKPEPLLFEPFHVVDYFASQGIKLDAAAIPKDKFEKQLKSFTQWLKVMKKVSAEPAPAYADPMVEAQAVESNTEKEVITEAMAEVLEKQGKFDKAHAVYEKLLLLHPEKGALFAARIEDLKTKQ